jgi:hypothetical protein
MQVMASESELGSSVGSQKAVGPVAARGGAEKFLLLVRRDDKQISAVEATCGTFACINDGWSCMCI